MAYPVLRGAREVVVFLPLHILGLIPPVSSFFISVLEEYAVHLVHLSPNSVMTLAIFAHACEMFIGVLPSVELFRYLFSLCRSSSASPGPEAAALHRMVGGCFFRMCPEHREGFINFSVKEKWENWERQWLYVEVPQDSPFPRLPDGPPVHDPRWNERPALDKRWDPVMDRLALLRQAGLSWVMVVFDFLQHHLAPLQACRNLAWSYVGEGDDARIARGAESDLDAIRLCHLMRLATDEGNLSAARLPGAVRPLCEGEGQPAVLTKMPIVDVRGLVLATDAVGAADSDVFSPARSGDRADVGGVTTPGVIGPSGRPAAEHHLGDASGCGGKHCQSFSPATDLLPLLPPSSRMPPLPLTGDYGPG
ncbi:membrane-associated protein-like [Panicum miliaceum]|uniref:Membrane-associated protein-like n=1 Tax=Panicum miliaceum TaxID=4540 RepID=A0A3L6REY3_PANMI|nr:membrane-associated protein-like [Panicum miliaceum]